MKRLVRYEKLMILDILKPYLEDEYIILNKEYERMSKKDIKIRKSYIKDIEKIINKLEN